MSCFALRRSAGKSLVAVALLTVYIASLLARDVAATDFEKSCLRVDGLARNFLTPAKPFTGDGGATRYVTANHKTGTYLAQCLCGVLTEEASTTDAAIPCEAGGFQHKSMGLQHTQGKGITSTNFCLNMVRNPFIMVHSGLEYHQSTHIPGEHWLYKPLEGPNATTAKGMQSALQDFKNLCRPGQSVIDDTLSYQDNLKMLPLNDSLLVEALRAVHSDIANMLVAAKRCVEVDAHAAMLSPQVGGCKNLLLDDVTPNFERGFTRFIAPALNVSASFAPIFASSCDPTSAHASKADQAHVTAHGEERDRAIKILRELDVKHLGGVLHTGESMLEKMVMTGERFAFR